MKTRNIQVKHLKHLENTLATYVYSHCNICNIQMKHLQHTFETAKIFETYIYNISIYSYCNICNTRSIFTIKIYAICIKTHKAFDCNVCSSSRCLLTKVEDREGVACCVSY